MAHDPVNHPSHYNSHPSGIECIVVTRHMSFNLGNVVKYLWRAGLKDRAPPSLQDLKKAAWYLNDEIAYQESLIKEEDITIENCRIVNDPYGVMPVGYKQEKGKS